MNRKKWHSQSPARLAGLALLVVLGLGGLALTSASTAAAPFIKKWSERKADRLLAQQEERREVLDAALARSAENDEMLRSVTAERREAVLAARERFYEERTYEPAWIDDGRPRSEVTDYLELLGRVDELGLVPGVYAAERLRAASEGGRRAWRRKSLDELMDLDVALTTSFMLFTFDNVEGRIDPRELDVEWYTENRKIDPAVLLAETLEGAGVERLEEIMLPWTERSKELRELLAHYRKLAADGGWEPVPEGDVLEVGDEVQRERLDALVERLLVEGDLEAQEAEAIRAAWPAPGSAPAEGAGSAERPIYDERLQAAVERFQTRNGLEIDGKFGPNTAAMMNISAEERVRQIEVNLERLRWMPEEEDGRRIMVNIPDFRLEAFDEKGEKVLEMPVVVGRETWPTPVFHDQMTYVEINPTWNVPMSIAVSETLQEVRKDPSYLAEKNFEVLTPEGEPVDPSSIDWSSVSAEGFPYRFRQRPGPDNALGQIKFMFPNQFNVYLHDTPAEKGFEVADRSLSHGCVRVERPLDLAEYVFAPKPEWSKERVAEVIASREITRVSLDEPLPVFLLYQTAFLGEDGRPHFRRDVYDQDKVLGEALERLHRRG